jgi:23S rRNA (cytosine1962-C5)-methyltransferase
MTEAEPIITPAEPAESAGNDADPGRRQTVRVLKGQSARLRRGHPWIFSNEIKMDADAKNIVPGSCVDLVDAGGERLGVASFNPHSLIAARMLSSRPDEKFDTAFFARRLESALRLRSALYDTPHYRLIHSEADGLPGLVVDRYGDLVVCQLNTAGMDSMAPTISIALGEVLGASAIVFRRDSRVRTLEGLERGEPVIEGEIALPVVVEEAGVQMLADPIGGQKTGWFFDQRENRDFVARLAKGHRVLDLFCHSGGFTLRAAAAGAKEVLGVDSSQSALDLATEAAERAGLSAIATFTRGDVFDQLAVMDKQEERYGVVIADPPAFAKSRKELSRALRAHRKLTRLAGRLVAPGGILVLACCAHQVGVAPFGEAIAKGLADLGRRGRIIRNAGAGPDHPVHPSLPESAYLKFVALALDD